MQHSSGTDTIEATLISHNENETEDLILWRTWCDYVKADDVENMESMLITHKDVLYTHYFPLTNQYQGTALHFAALHASTKALQAVITSYVRYLYEQGITFPLTEEQWTPLHMAVAAGRKQAAVMLIEQCIINRENYVVFAHTEAQDHRSWLHVSSSEKQPLDLALEQENTLMVQTLLHLERRTFYDSLLLPSPTYCMEAITCANLPALRLFGKKGEISISEARSHSEKLSVTAADSPQSAAMLAVLLHYGGHAWITQHFKTQKTLHPAMDKVEVELRNTPPVQRTGLYHLAVCIVDKAIALHTKALQNAYPANEEKFKTLTPKFRKVLLLRNLIMDVMIAKGVDLTHDFSAYEGVITSTARLVQKDVFTLTNKTDYLHITFTANQLIGKENVGFIERIYKGNSMVEGFTKTLAMSAIGLPRIPEPFSFSKFLEKDNAGTGRRNTVI